MATFDLTPFAATYPSQPAVLPIFVKSAGQQGPPWWLSGKESTCQCLPVQETWVQSLGGQDPLEKEMTTHSRILAWEIPSVEPGPQSIGPQKNRT